LIWMIMRMRRATREWFSLVAMGFVYTASWNAALPYVSLLLYPMSVFWLDISPGRLAPSPAHIKFVKLFDAGSLYCSHFRFTVFEPTLVTFQRRLNRRP
jgi:hypothetical protein